MKPQKLTLFYRHIHWHETCFSACERSVLNVSWIISKVKSTISKGKSHNYILLLVKFSQTSGSCWSLQLLQFFCFCFTLYQRMLADLSDLIFVLCNKYNTTSSRSSSLSQVVSLYSFVCLFVYIIAIAWFIFLHFTNILHIRMVSPSIWLRSIPISSKPHTKLLFQLYFMQHLSFAATARITTK